MESEIKPNPKRKRMNATKKFDIDALRGYSEFVNGMAFRYPGMRETIEYTNRALICLAQEIIREET